MNRSFRQSVVVIVTLTTLLALIQASQAQRRGRGGMRYGNVTAVQLLQVSDVQKELTLTDDQLTKARSIYEELAVGRGQVMATVPKEGGKRGPKIAELNKKADGEVESLLDPTQNKRMTELLLQVNGANELAKDNIQSALHLTDEQKKQLSEVRRENAKARREARANPDADRWAQNVELQKKADAKLMEVLTPEQKKQFEEMKGEKLDLDLLSL
jgi:hypothetical protein